MIKSINDIVEQKQKIIINLDNTNKLIEQNKIGDSMEKIVKIKDLVEYLEKQHCSIDTHYYNFIQWWIKEKCENDNLSYEQVISLELDEYLAEINEFLDSCFRHEFDAILWDTKRMILKNNQLGGK